MVKEVIRFFFWGLIRNQSLNYFNGVISTTLGTTAGMISLKDWASATERALNLGLPWRVLRPQLVGDTQQGMVDYQQWMREFSISDARPEVSCQECFFCDSGEAPNLNVSLFFTRQGSDDSILETMYRNHSNLETIFRIIDTDHSGEWVAGLPDGECVLTTGHRFNFRPTCNKCFHEADYIKFCQKKEKKRKVNRYVTSVDMQLQKKCLVALLWFMSISSRLKTHLISVKNLFSQIWEFQSLGVSITGF